MSNIDFFTKSKTWFYIPYRSVLENCPLVCYEFKSSMSVKNPKLVLTESYN